MAGAGSPWEDAAITKSWDRVVSDYKTFHDVRARGGTVDDLQALLKDAPARPETKASHNAKPETSRRTAPSGAMTAGNADEDASGEVVGGDGFGEAPTAQGKTTGQASKSAQPRASAPIAGTNGQAFSAAASNTPPAPGLLSPQTVLGGADEGLKKLLMSWYYAGYYAGLYEGQQRAAQQQQQQPSYEEEEAQVEDQGADGIDLDLDDSQEMQQ